MAWRVARSLDVLLHQLDAAAPHRSRASDGSIGDAAHASRASDHNPDAAGVVRARDFTHDPAGGLDCHKLAAALVAGRDPRIKYVIWDRRIVDSRPGLRPWTWQPYGGPNPHTAHLHLSVVADARADSTDAWAVDAVIPEDDVAWSDALPTPSGRHIRADDLLVWTNHYANMIPALTAKVDALSGALSDDEANIVAAVRELAASAPACDADLSPQQVDAFADRVLAQLPEEIRGAVRDAFARVRSAS